jgi:hypothetical protein
VPRPKWPYSYSVVFCVIMLLGFLGWCGVPLLVWSVSGVSLPVSGFCMGVSCLDCGGTLALLCDGGLSLLNVVPTFFSSSIVWDHE